MYACEVGGRLAKIGPWLHGSVNQLIRSRIRIDDFSQAESITRPETKEDQSEKGGRRCVSAAHLALIPRYCTQQNGHHRGTPATTPSPPVRPLVGRGAPPGRIPV